MQAQLPSPRQSPWVFPHCGNTGLLSGMPHPSQDLPVTLGCQVALSTPFQIAWMTASTEWGLTPCTQGPDLGTLPRALAWTVAAPRNRPRYGLLFEFIGWLSVLNTSSLQCFVISGYGRDREVLGQVWFLNFPTKVSGELLLQKAFLYLVALWFWTNHVIFLGLFSHLQNEVGLSKLALGVRVNESWSLLSSLPLPFLAHHCAFFSFLWKMSHPFPLLFCNQP